MRISVGISDWCSSDLVEHAGAAQIASRKRAGAPAERKSRFKRRAAAHESPREIPQPSSSPRAPMPQSPGRRPAWPHHRGAHHMSADAPAVPQLTLRAIILSVILAMILAAANAYLGLFAGLTIATAIPAAVVSMAVLRVLGGDRKSTRLNSSH